MRHLPILLGPALSVCLLPIGKRRTGSKIGKRRTGPKLAQCTQCASAPVRLLPLADQTTIITAAHCCEFRFPGNNSLKMLPDGQPELDFNLDRYYLSLGTVDLVPTYEYPVRLISPIRIIVHPEYHKTKVK